MIWAVLAFFLGVACGYVSCAILSFGGRDEHAY